MNFRFYSILSEDFKITGWETIEEQNEETKLMFLVLANQSRNPSLSYLYISV